jgi:hypothetical protein
MDHCSYFQHVHYKLFLKLDVRTPSPSGQSGMSLKQDTSLHTQHPTSGQLLRDSKCCSPLRANPFGNCRMDSKYCSPKSSSALDSCSLNFNNCSTSKVNPLDSCLMEFKNRSPSETNPLGSCPMDY